MSKPSWDSAPEWANWLAMDSDSEWFWYISEPHLDQDVDELDWWSYDKFQQAFPVYGSSNTLENTLPTLEKRP